MKKFYLLALIASVLLTSCADHKTIDGVTYRPYGFFNDGSAKNDSIYYEVSGKAVCSGVFFSEFFLIPTVYTFGFNLYEPKCSMKEHLASKVK